MSKLLSRITRRRAIGRFAYTSIAVTLALVMASGPAINIASAARPGNAGNGVKAPKSMLPLTINEVVVENGQLVALGTLGANPVRLPIGVSTSPNLLDPDCPILNLEIGAIHLNLLGLNVDTSDICLDITAHAGEGLLGDLLCAISNLLAGGLDLGAILGGILNADELETVLDGIRDLLNEVLGAATAPDAIVSVSGTTPGACDILNLALGPVDLNLLGLQVELDDCNDGPVTVDITAVPGEGLLGDLLAGLLCDLDDLLGGGATGNAIKQLLNQIVGVINQIIAILG
jgi:hypothetical protein